ncbi:hypothetical protein HNQ77_001042 [Silvibacterium bohemicum]|uniref:Uncharacterized protein n=1 Tax=Silvibacterium bohemicum TaxID=1577686 RepID=A0A841JXD0_9BACT|nr:hypothetical protein [Silvibacterium bohemicum]MBB6143098.1 hypothetical protein [Silvibacterium bohemicum]
MALNSLHKLGADETRAMNNQSAEFRSLLRKQTLALVGFSVCSTGLLAILALVLWPIKQREFSTAMAAVKNKKRQPR